MFLGPLCARPPIRFHRPKKQRKSEKPTDVSRVPAAPVGGEWGKNSVDVPSMASIRRDCNIGPVDTKRRHLIRTLDLVKTFCPPAAPGMDGGGKGIVSVPDFCLVKEAPRSPAEGRNFPKKKKKKKEKTELFCLHPWGGGRG